MSTSLSGAAAATWNSLSWVPLKNAALIRGLLAGTVKNLTPTQRRAHCDTVTLRITEWYAFDTERPAPEVLNREGLIEEASTLTIVLSDDELDHLPEADLRKRLVKEHILLKASADFDASAVSGEAGEGDTDDTGEHSASDSEEDPSALQEETLDPPPVYGNQFVGPLPQAGVDDDPLDLEASLEDLGYPYCSGAGMAIKLFPLRNPERPILTRAQIPPMIRRLFGTVYAVHHLNGTSGDATDVIQEFRIITGLTHASKPNDYSFEVFHLKDSSMSSLRSDVLATMDRAPDISTAFSISLDALGSDCNLYDTFSQLSSGSHYSKVHSVIVIDKKLDLPHEYAKIHSLPRVLTSNGTTPLAGNSSQPAATIPGTSAPISANFSDRSEQDNIKRAEALRKHLADGIAPVLTALERKMEAYEQPVNQNLVTGNTLDPRLTEAKKLSELAQSYSLVESGADICCFCVCCTSGAIELAREEDPNTDLSNPEVLKSLLVYGSPGTICCMVCPGKNGKGQPLHPNIFVPTVCYSCEKLVYFRGTIAFACPHCSFSYIMPSGGSQAGRSRQSESEQEINDNLALENRVFQYLRLTGGPDAPFLGSSTDITSARYRMSQRSQAFFQEDRDYTLTPRHVLYGPALKYSKSPNGLHGLSVRDFIPTRARLYEYPAAAGENREAEYETWNEDAYGTATRLTKWVSENMPYSPPWPKIDNPVVGESVIMRALDNMGSFLLDMGKRRETDVDLTKKALKLEMVGINADALPMVEHKIAITFYTFYSRIREQAADFRFNRQYEFEKKAGPFIRLVYTPTLPLIIQEINLPLEQHMHFAAVTVLYAEKFGSTGYLLSNETDAPTKKTRKKKNASSTVASGGSSHRNSPLTAQMLKSAISLQAGNLIGERLPNSKSVLNAVPITDSGQAICANFQTTAGCHVGDLPCPLAHIKCLQFNPESQRYFLARGGHTLWGTLSIESQKPWLPKQFASEHSELITAQLLALKHTDRVLEKLGTGNSEKRPIRSVTQGIVTKLSIPITTATHTPIPLWSTSGVRATSISQLTLGVGDAYLDGNSWDCGDTIDLLNGHVLHNRCMVKALASQIRPPRVFVSEKGRSLEIELSIQILEGLLAIDITSLPLNSRSAEIYVSCSKVAAHGYNEALLDLVSPPLLAHSNVILVSQGEITEPNNKKGLSVRLWPAGATMHTPRENWRKTAKQAAEFFTDWKWGHSAICADLVGIASVFQSDSDDRNLKKHASGYDLPKKLHSFSQLTALLGRYTEFDRKSMEIRVVSKASLGSLARERSTQPVSKLSLATARAAIRKELDFILANSCSDAPYRLATLKKQEADLLKAKAPKAKASSSTTAQGCMPGPFLHEPPSTTDKEKLRRSLSAHPSALAGIKYMDLIRTLDPKIDRSSADSVESALLEAQASCTAWYKIEESHPSCSTEDLSYQDVTARMVGILRHLAFGNRVSEGPDWDEIPPEVRDSLSEGHLGALEELTLYGHDSAWVGPQTGYMGDERSGLEDAALQVLSSMWDSLTAWKGLPLHEDLETELIDLGLLGAPMSVVEKLDDRKQRRYDEKAKAYKLRCVTDHSDSGHTHALNSGTASYRTTRQVTTDNASTAALAITEESQNPNSLIGQEKNDYTGAFTIVQLILERCKERSIKFRRIILLNLCLTFGGGDAPGAWEILGSAPSCSTCVIPWPDPSHDGDSVPSHTRFVDDTHHFAAYRGNRQDRYSKGFKSLMRIWAGKDSLNIEKDLESGGYTLRQHGFGKLVDSLTRKISTPLSRLCRTEDKLSRYLDDPKARFYGLEVPSARGSLSSTLESAPGLGALIYSRFDAMLATTTQEYGTKRPPATYQPSPALDGETREEAEAMLRLTVTLAWRLASLNDGEFLTANYEQWLPFGLRITCPGKERLQQFLFPESDASGKALLFFDPVTGVYIQEFYSKGEIDAMFDYDRADHGIIITNMEGYADTIGIPLTTFDHPDPVMVIPRNDNMGFVDNLNGNKTTNVKNLHCIITLRVWSYLTGIDLHAIYVKTDDNLRADPGSRPEKAGEWLTELAKWEAATGRKARKLSVPTALRDLSAWTSIPTADNLHKRVHDSFSKILALLDFYEEAGTSHRLRIPLATARRVIQDCIDGKPVPKLDRTKKDFVEDLGPSDIRTKIMSGPAHRTRITLTKLVSRQPTAISKLRKEAHAGTQISHQEVFNMIMQQQFHLQRHLLWQPSLSFTGPPINTRLGSPVLHTPLTDVTLKIRFAELYAGRASLSRSCNDSGGGVTVAVSEHNPRNWDELLHALPQARLFESNEAMSLHALEQLEVEGVGGGSPCQAHSGGNKHARGNNDTAAGGDEYERAGSLMSKMYNDLGPAFQVWENSPGVKKRQPGRSHSPYEELLRLSPNFTDAMHGFTLQASSTESPLTGVTTPLNHERLFVVLVNKACFPTDASIRKCIPQTATSDTASSLLDTDAETPGRYVMPDQDVYGFKFKHSHTKATGLCVSGTIDDPVAGMGWGSFPNQGWDPHSGYAATMTSGGARWLHTRFNSHPHFVHATNSEYARLYQFRDPPLDPKWLSPESEFGMHVISHSIVQSVADAVMVSVMKLYTAPMSLPESKLKGFDHCVTPQTVFHHLRKQSKLSRSSTACGYGDGEDDTPSEEDRIFNVPLCAGESPEPDPNHSPDQSMYDWGLDSPTPEIVPVNETAAGYVQSDDDTASAGYSPEIPSSDSDQEDPIGIRFHGDQPDQPPVGRVITGVPSFRYSRVPLLSPEGAFHAGFQFPLSRNLTPSVDRTTSSLPSDVCYRGAPSPFTGPRLPNVQYFDRGPDETAHQAARRRYQAALASQVTAEDKAPTDHPNPHYEDDIGAPERKIKALTPTCKPSPKASAPEDEDPDSYDEGRLAHESITRQYNAHQSKLRSAAREQRQEEDKKRQKQQALWDQTHVDPPEPLLTSLVCLPQESVARVCSHIIESMFNEHTSKATAPEAVPPMLLTSKACVSRIIEDGMFHDSLSQLLVMTIDYELDQSTIIQGKYPTQYETEYFNIFGGTPAVSAFLGHLARSLIRDLKVTDIPTIAAELHSFDSSLGVPLFNRLDWGEPNLVPHHVLTSVGISRSALQLFYPHLLVDAARNILVYRHFQLSQSISRVHANLSRVSRKFYVTFSPLVKSFKYDEHDRLLYLHSLLKNKLRQTDWHIPRDWPYFRDELENEESIWRARFPFQALCQILPSTRDRDFKYDAVHNSRTTIPNAFYDERENHNNRHHEFERYTVLRRFNLTQTTGFSDQIYRESDQCFWSSFTPHDMDPRPADWCNRLREFTSSLNLNWIPPALLSPVSWFQGKISSSTQTAGSDMDNTENRGRLTQVKKKRTLAKSVVKQHFIGPSLPAGLFDRDQKAIHIAHKNKRSRAVPIIDDEVNERIDEILIRETNPKRAKVVHQQAQHYLDFCHASKLEPLITNPLDTFQHKSLLRFAGYERVERKIKSDSIKAKFEAIDRFHTENGLTAPSIHCDQLQRLLARWKKVDAPSQPRIPVSHQIIELYTLENPMITEDQKAKPAGMALGLEVCMRSCEYSAKDNGEYDPKAIHWRDLFYRNKTEVVTGHEIMTADRLTCSVPSNKNSLLRCTRTIFQTSSPVSAVRLLKQRYLDILLRTGSVPDPHTPVFLLSTGKPISRREISSTIQSMLESLGVPSRFSGSHSLRRGGSCMYRAAGMPDADVARFGRWTSNAYKLYIHIESSALAEWSELAAQQMPRFELN